jgi:hypothetical protein
MNWMDQERTSEKNFREYAKDVLKGVLARKKVTKEDVDNIVACMRDHIQTIALDAVKSTHESMKDAIDNSAFGQFLRK